MYDIFAPFSFATTNLSSLKKRNDYYSVWFSRTKIIIRLSKVNRKSSTAIRITAAVRKRQSLRLKIISMHHVSQSVRIIAKECTRSPATCAADHVSACSSLCASLSSSSSTFSPAALPFDSSSSILWRRESGAPIMRSIPRDETLANA